MYNTMLIEEYGIIQMKNRENVEAGIRLNTYPEGTRILNQFRQDITLNVCIEIYAGDVHDMLGACLSIASNNVDRACYDELAQFDDDLVSIRNAASSYLKPLSRDEFDRCQYRINAARKTCQSYLELFYKNLYKPDSNQKEVSKA